MEMESQIPPDSNLPNNPPWPEKWLEGPPTFAAANQPWRHTRIDLKSQRILCPRNLLGQMKRHMPGNFR
jgi:hypothetical protein